MHRQRWTRVVPVVGVLLLLVLSSGFLAASTPRSPTAGATVPATGAVPLERSSGAAASVGSPNALRSGATERSPAGLHLSPEARAVEQQIADGRFAARNALLPTPYVASSDPASGPITPLQQAGPAPMGLADLGLGKTGGYEYNTSGFAGTVHLTSFAAYSPGYPSFQEAPDWTTIQLNTVGVNLTYPGMTDGTFWFQNVVHFNGSTLEFEDNIWNFSSPTARLLVSPFFQHASGGRVEAGLFYYDYWPTTYTVRYPFTLTLNNELAIVGNRPAVFFNFSLTEASGPTNISNQTFDEVIFNGPANVSAPPQFQVNGLQYDPELSEYDAELTIGGDGGGTNANIVQAQGNLTLDRWNGSAVRFQSVPSAYDHGVDSAETSTGISAYYLGTTEYLGQGPALLYGLWNTTAGAAGPAASPGYIQVSLTVSPAYAFVFGTNETAYATTLVRANLTPAPASPAGLVSVRLPPPLVSNPYVFAAWADGYGNGSVTVTDNGTGTVSLDLLPSSSTLDTPIYLNGDASVTQIGSSGLPDVQYSAARSTLWINGSTDALAPPFLRVNDYGYPTFVLFAAQRVNLTLRVDGFVQAPSTFQYTSWNASAGLTTRSIPGWTQSYGLFYGTGKFFVTNTTVIGNTTLDYAQVYAPAAVEFYHTNGSQASGITTGQESLGVDATASTNVTLVGIAGQTGANAVTLVNSTAVTATRISANGTDYRGFVTWAVDISGGSGFTLRSVSVTNESVGLVVNDTSRVGVTYLNASGTSFGGTAGQINATSGFEVQNMVLTAGSTGLIINASTNVNLTNISVAENGYAGNISVSSGIVINNLTVLQSAAGGFDLWDDSNLSVTHGSAVGPTSTVVDSLTDSQHAFLGNLMAEGQAAAITATNVSYVTIQDVGASDGSVGTSLTNARDVNVTGVFATNGSIGLVWNVGSQGVIRTATVGLNCTGVDVSNATNVSVDGVVAAESALVFPYFVNPLTFLQYPVAPVVFYNNSNVSVSNVSADEFPFAVWENYTNYSRIQNVTAWNGLYGIQVNASIVLTIASVFVQNNLYGLTLNNVTRANITGSTFEDSGALGINATNDSYVHIYGNNFVANNNSSTAGTFSALHKQVYVNNSTGFHFNSSFGLGNYWADHSGTGAYVITSSPLVQDAEPQPQFLGNYLRFVAVGLLPLTLWGFGVTSVNYSTYAPLLFIPSWTLGSGSYPYTVHPEGAGVPSPSSGTVVFTGADQNVTIVFSHVLTFAVSGLPRGTTWQVVFNGTTESVTVSGAGTAGINLSVSNAKYSYALKEVAGYWQTNLSASGSITVSGANVTEALVYAAFTYAVTIKEVGLPSNTEWSVVIGGSTRTSTTGSLVVDLPNASYPFTVGSVSGYSSSPSAGTLVVNGGATSLTVTFSTPSPAGISPWVYAGIGAGVVVVLLVVVWMSQRRRRSKPRARDDNVFD